VVEPAPPAPERRWIPFGAGLLTVVLLGMGWRALDASAAQDEPLPAPVVAVRATGCTELRAGSGTVVGPRLVVTAGHVVDRAIAVEVETPQGPVPGTVVAVDPDGRDLALVLVDEPLGVVVGRDGGLVEAGETLVATGYPYGGPVATVTGEAVGLGPAVAYEQPGDALVVVSAPFPPGTSGGPIVDAAGRLVAVVVGTEQASGTGLGVPVHELAGLVDDGARPVAPVCLPPAVEPAARGLARVE
jgi:S1-C subfamily serine protease